MADFNTVNLINQMRTMASEAEGIKVDSVSSGQGAFGSFLQQALGQVNNLSQTADGLKTRFELGDPNVSLGEVMIASQKSSLGFEATLRVRNKVVQAYQDIMNMPV